MYAWKRSSGMGVYLLVSVSENMYITTYSQFLDWTTLFPCLCTTNSKNEKGRKPLMNTEVV